MSYILDALRKADAQRESDPARGIHAQPARAGNDEPRQEGYRTGFWLATVAGLAALAAVGWYLYRENGPAAIEPVARTEVVVPAVAPPAPPAAESAAPAAAPPATAVLPPPVVVAPPIVTKAEPVPAAARHAPDKSTGAAAVAQRQPPAPAGAAAPHAPGAAAPITTAVATATASAAKAAAPVADAAPPIAGLPADAPKLAITGGVYSANVAQRMLIVNGQVFNEGSEIGPGVVLEEVRPKSAVVRFRGSRYTMGY
jgi:general secretion pathway protein B